MKAVGLPYLDVPPRSVSRTFNIGHGAPVAGGFALIALHPPCSARETASACASLDLTHIEALVKLIDSLHQDRW